MGKEEKNILKNSLQLFDAIVESSGNNLVYQNYRYTRDYVLYGRHIAKSEDINRTDYELGLIALIIFELSHLHQSGKDLEMETLVNRVSTGNNFSDNEITQLRDYIDFFRTEAIPKNKIEMVLSDCRNIHLGLPDAFERMAQLRKELEINENKKYSDLEWEQFCQDHYLGKNFYTNYAIDKYGVLRGKNFSEIERRIEKLNIERNKNKKGTPGDDLVLTDKEGENLFKIAFRNYLNLVVLADRKAHLLIEVNSILASVIIGFSIKRADNASYYIIPTVMILLVAALTIFYAIMASKPLKKFKNMNSGEKEHFFFGSFDKIDPDFRTVSWEKYATDISQLFKGNKELVFNDLIKESFQVRKVLSRKFGYLSIAYKIFIIGQLVSIAVFLAMIIARS